MPHPFDQPPMTTKWQVWDSSPDTGIDLKNYVRGVGSSVP